MRSRAQRVEIACDESGYEGEKLVGGVTDVFAHAGVLLAEEDAAGCIEELRRRIRSPATEYKANHVLRSKHRPVLLWLLGPEGPLLGNAQVYLVDKAFFLVDKLVDQLVPDADEQSAALYREGRRALDPDLWAAFLEASNNLLRSKDREAVDDPVDEFFHAVDVLRLASIGSRADDILDRLSQTRPRADAYRADLLNDPFMLPVLDPLMQAIVRVVDYWGVEVSIAHDRQTTLPHDRIVQLQETVSTGRLAELTLRDSFSHPRVQVADFLAGVARKIASDQLKGSDDAELTTLLRPYVDPLSVWADEVSWSRLAP